jgi:hypothetical protein
LITLTNASALAKSRKVTGKSLSTEIIQHLKRLNLAVSYNSGGTVDLIAYATKNIPIPKESSRISY